MVLINVIFVINTYKIRKKNLKKMCITVTKLIKKRCVICGLFIKKKIKTKPIIDIYINMYNTQTYDANTNHFIPLLFTYLSHSLCVLVLFVNSTYFLRIA